jgi:two-component system cell cycle sensor histidine kinase PleC
MAEFSDSFGSNVTRQKASLALNAAKVEAELASKAKSEFIANMSHELRTPLNAIIGFSDMLGTLKISDPERVNQYSGYIHEAAEHLLALINDILDVSKIQAGKLEVEQIETDISDIVSSCQLIVDAKAKEKDILLEFSLPDNLPLVYADPLRVKQILLNLLSNAVKFTGDKGKVSCSARDMQDGYVCISVQDTGQGMTEMEIDTALRPFGQVNSGFDKQHEGTGLGLPISNELAKMHNGALKVQSEKGVGTLVSIFLPTMKKARPENSAQAAIQ